LLQLFLSDQRGCVSETSWYVDKLYFISHEALKHKHEQHKHHVTFGEKSVRITTVVVQHDFCDSKVKLLVKGELFCMEIK